MGFASSGAVVWLSWPLGDPESNPTSQWVLQIGVLHLPPTRVTWVFSEVAAEPVLCGELMDACAADGSVLAAWED